MAQSRTMIRTIVRSIRLFRTRHSDGWDRYDGQSWDGQTGTQTIKHGYLKRSTIFQVRLSCFFFPPRFLLLQLVLRNHRDAFRKELESVAENGHSFEKCKEILKESGSLSIEPSQGFRFALLKVVVICRHQTRHRFQRFLQMVQSE